MGCSPRGCKVSDTTEHTRARGPLTCPSTSCFLPVWRLSVCLSSGHPKPLVPSESPARSARRPLVGWGHADSQLLSQHSATFYSQHIPVWVVKYMFVLRPPDKLWFLLGKSASTCLRERCRLHPQAWLSLEAVLCLSGSTACLHSWALSFIGCIIGGWLTRLALASVFLSIKWES